MIFGLIFLLFFVPSVFLSIYFNNRIQKHIFETKKFRKASRALFLSRFFIDVCVYSVFVYAIKKIIELNIIWFVFYIIMTLYWFHLRQRCRISLEADAKIINQQLV